MSKKTQEGFWEEPENTKTVKQLIRQLKTPIGLVPFVGAGISIPYGYSGWTEFLLAFATEFGLKNKIQKRIDCQEYEEAADDLENEVGSFTLSNAIKETYGENPKTPLSKITAAHYIPFISNGPVITTNFDRILEKIFKEYNKEFLEVVWGAKADLVRQVIGEGQRFLLKVHGDAFDQTDRILTLSEYRQHYGDLNSNSIYSLEPDRPLPYLLYRIMSSRRLFFIGCSLVNDRTLLILKYLANKPAALDHYAILPKPESIDELREKIKKYGDDYRIRPIWIPLDNNRGFEQLVDFLEYLIKETYPTNHSVIKLINALETKNWSEAYNLVENEKTSYPIPHQVRYLLLIEQGIRALKREELPRASELFASAIGLNPNDPKSFFLKGMIDLAQERWSIAIECFETCLRFEPENENAKVFLGVALVCRNDDNKDRRVALEVFNKALETNPEDKWALFGKSVLMIAENNFDEAHKWIDLLEKNDDEDTFKLAHHLSKAAPGKWWKRPFAFITTNIVITLVRVFIRKIVIKYFDELYEFNQRMEKRLQSSSGIKALPPGKTDGD